MGLQRPGRLRRGSRRQSAPGRLRLLACAAVPAVLGALAGCGEAFAGETRVPARALRPSAEQAAPDARSASAGSTTRVARRFMPKGKEEKKVVIANAGTPFMLGVASGALLILAVVSGKMVYAAVLAALTGLLAFFANDAGVLDVKVAVPQSKAAKRSLNLELDADTLEEMNHVPAKVDAEHVVREGASDAASEESGSYTKQVFNSIRLAVLGRAPGSAAATDLLPAREHRDHIVEEHGLGHGHLGHAGHADHADHLVVGHVKGDKEYMLGDTQVDLTTHVAKKPPQPPQEEEEASSSEVPGMAEANTVVETSTEMQRVEPKSKLSGVELLMDAPGGEILAYMAQDGWEVIEVDASKGIFDLYLPSVDYNVGMGSVAIPSPRFRAVIKDTNVKTADGDMERLTGELILQNGEDILTVKLGFPINTTLRISAAGLGKARIGQSQGKVYLQADVKIGMQLPSIPGLNKIMQIFVKSYANQSTLDCCAALAMGADRISKSTDVTNKSVAAAALAAAAVAATEADVIGIAARGLQMVAQGAGELAPQLARVSEVIPEGMVP